MFGPQTTNNVTTVDPTELWLPAGESAVPADWSEMTPTADEDWTGEGRPTFQYWEAVNVGDSDGRGDLWAIVVNGDVAAVEVTGGDSAGPHLIEQHELDTWTASYLDDIEDVYGLDKRNAEETRRDAIAKRVEEFNYQGAQMYAKGPMMSYWYPVTNSTDEDEGQTWANLIRDLPLCVVEVGGRMGLALTGGGMDLSWEIAEAFARIGYFPPGDVVDDLPKMSGRGQSAADLAIIRVVHAGLVQRAERAQLRASRMAEAWPIEGLHLDLPAVP